MDALAARGVRFERAYATAPITLPLSRQPHDGPLSARTRGAANGVRMELRSTHHC